MSALRIDEASGLEERLELVRHAAGTAVHLVGPTTRSHLLRPHLQLGARRLHRQLRQGTRRGPCRGRAGVRGDRFHYAGEGNSEGERRDMTLVHDVRRRRSRSSTTLGLSGSSRFAMLGTRIGALVAAARRHRVGVGPAGTVGTRPRSAALSGRSQTCRPDQPASQGDDERAGDWREELDATGRLDLIGYDVYQPMVDSLGVSTWPTCSGTRPAPSCSPASEPARGSTNRSTMGWSRPGFLWTGVPTASTSPGGSTAPRRHAITAG